MNKVTPCRIESVGKRRDGGTRYWCLEHKADATAKYGTRAPACRYSHVPTPSPEQTLELALEDFPGGIAMWGSVPPVFDTTEQEVDKGIHVHARIESGGKKSIDRTYRAVAVRGMGQDLFAENFIVSELPAIYFMVSHVFGFETKVLVCPRCNNLHLDKDWFAVHPHKKHLCEGCGRMFSESTEGIGNPLAWLRERSAASHNTKPSKQSLSIKQADYSGGIQIWGSNPALVWTGERTEETGIHVHAYGGDSGGELVIDDTFRAVEIDGTNLNPLEVRYAMAQSALPHLRDRLVSLRCIACGDCHFDQNHFAFTPHKKHVCDKCGQCMSAPGRMRNTICNPVLDHLANLAHEAVRVPRTQPVELLVEAP